MTGPDPRFTRGEVVATDREQACAWGHTPRPYEIDRAAYEESAHYVFGLYGVPWSRRREFELDHLVPRCIGGADTARNLWPQPLGDAKVKDVDERRICRAVCYERSMKAQEGQRFFSEGKWR